MHLCSLSLVVRAFLSGAAANIHQVLVALFCSRGYVLFLTYQTTRAGGGLQEVWQVRACSSPAGPPLLASVCTAAAGSACAVVVGNAMMVRCSDAAHRQGLAFDLPAAVKCRRLSCHSRQRRRRQ